MDKSVYLRAITACLASGSMLLHSVVWSQECDPCFQLYERSVAVKKKCDGLADQEQSLCLDEFIRVSDSWYACKDKALAGGTAGACPVADKPKPPKPPLANCGLEIGIPVDVPFTINADTFKEFMDIANSREHGVFTVGTYSHASVLDEDGKVTDPQYRIARHIFSPRFGETRASAKDGQVMAKAVVLMRNHELGHDREFIRVAKQAACDSVGKTSEEADAIFRDMHCNKLPAVQKATDMRDGGIEWKTDKKGMVVDVKLVPFDRPIAAYTPKECQGEGEDQ